jgi:PmbA protein
VTASAAQEGSDSEMGSEFDFGHTFDALRLDWVARQCADRAVQRLGGKPCPTGAVPVVLDNRVMTSFLQVIGPALMANNVLKGKSLFAGRVGERIASNAITLVDQNDLDTALSPAPFDGEGASAQRTVLVSNGVLGGYLHNAYTAHKMGETSTANAGRGGFRSPPEVGVTNAFIEPGVCSQEALLARAGDGLFVTQAMGVHMANPVSGDFSFGASGRLIERGVLGRPIRGVTIAGNVKDLLLNVTDAGNDLRFFGAYGAPSVLVSQLMVSGE